MAMKKLGLNKSDIMALSALALAILTYIGAKAMYRYTTWSATSDYVQAIVYVALVFVMYVLIEKSKNVYYGIMASIFIIRVMPPEHKTLGGTSVDAYFVYYIFTCFTVLLFAYEIYKLYKSQQVMEIRPLAIVGLICVLPFFNEMSEVVSNYLYYKTESMMLPYAATAGFHILSMGILMVVALVLGGKSGTLICDYGIVTCLIKMANKAFSAIVLARADMHVSKSYICYVVIFAVLTVLYALVRRKVTKNALAEAEEAKEAEEAAAETEA